MNKQPRRKVVAISMPQDLYDETLTRLKRNRFSTMSEYIRDLIRKDEWAEYLADHRNNPLEQKRVEFTPAAEW